MTEPALKQRLSDAIKASMKAGEKQRLTTLLERGLGHDDAL